VIHQLRISRDLRRRFDYACHFRLRSQLANSVQEFVCQRIVVIDHSDALKSAFASQDLCARAKCLLHARQIDRGRIADEDQPTSDKFTSDSSICCAADLLDKSLPARRCIQTAASRSLDELLACEEVDYALRVVVETPQFGQTVGTESAQSRLPEHYIGEIASRERSKRADETKFRSDVVLSWPYSHM
jgi:hypothetical protein